jgi:hypothetical protein
VNLTWLRSSVCTPQSPIRKKLTRRGGQLKLPMAGLEPARALFGPTDFYSDERHAIVTSRTIPVLATLFN